MLSSVMSVASGHRYMQTSRVGRVGPVANRDARVSVLARRSLIEDGQQFVRVRRSPLQVNRGRGSEAFHGVENQISIEILRVEP